MAFQYQPTSTLARLPLELIELIFDHYAALKTCMRFTVPVLGHHRYFVTLSLVCKRWTFIAQKFLWKHANIWNDRLALRVLNSPALGRYSMTSLELWKIKPQHANDIMAKLSSLRELTWEVYANEEAPWWNNESLAALTTLKLKTPLVLPQDPKPCFQLKHFSVHFVTQDLGFAAIQCARILGSCAATITTLEFPDDQIPSWLDCSGLPKLRTLRASFYYQGKQINRDGLEGVHHIRFLHIDDFEPEVLNFNNLPSTLQSLELVSEYLCGSRIDQHPQECVWSRFFGAPVQKLKSALPALKLIRLILPLGTFFPTHSSGHTQHQQITQMTRHWRNLGIQFEVKLVVNIDEDIFRCY